MTASDAKPSAPRRVLIVKPSSLGDVVTAMPVLRGLRRTFGDIHVAWLITDTCRPLIEHDRDVDECVLFERRRLGRAWRSPAAAWRLRALWKRLRRGRYDWVLDLQGLLRSALLSFATRARVRAGFADAREGATLFYTHRASAPEELHTVDRNIALARELGIDARGEDMTLRISEAAGQFARDTVARHDLSDGFVICVPPTRWPTKLYPVRHWRTVVAALVEHTPVVLLGGPGDVQRCRAVADGLGPAVHDLSGKTDVAQMMGLIAASSGVVCSDSAAKFIAPAVGVGVVTLIGPTRRERTGPYVTPPDTSAAGPAPFTRTVVADAPCQGCLRKRCPHITCMALIDPADVISAAEAMLLAGRR